MYAWRARIGLVKPTHRGKSFAPWYTTAPEGVEIVPTFIGFRSGTRKGFEGGTDRAVELARQLREVGCEAVVVSGSPPFLLEPPAFEQEWRAKLEDELGIHVLTPVEPHALAMRAVGAKRVALATYYTEDLNNALVASFAAFGVDGIPLDGYQKRPEGSNEDLYSTPLMTLDNASYLDVYNHVRRSVRSLDEPVDAVYINGGGWDAGRAVEPLEDDLGIPVVWAIAADIWSVYQVLGIKQSVPGYGKLLSDSPRSPERILLK